MALRVRSFYPTNIAIDGELLAIRITRMDPEQALDFNQRFASFSGVFESKPETESDKIKTPEEKAVEAAHAAEQERDAKRFVVEAISKYVKVEPDQLYQDDEDKSLLEGADLCKLFGARDEVLSELLLQIFMENKLNNEQKHTWKTKLAPFVPTPVAVADRMMEDAGVTAADVVYDLGCGDGALCIAAAKRGATAVGFDLDNVRISAARAAAKEAGVEALCTFKQQDALTADLTVPSVVAIYLLSGALGKLRPMFEEKLQKGARIVSHAFTLGGGWEADSSVYVAPEEGQSLAHSGANWVYTYSVDRRREKTGA